MTTYHTAALAAGFLLDLLFGDPQWLAHPIRLIGWLIAETEKGLYGEKHPVLRGALAVCLVLFFTTAATAAILGCGYALHPVMGMCLESIMTYQILAVKSLRSESMKVYDRLREGNTEAAREALSRIVGRDTSPLDEPGIVRAAVETVAENTSDGVIAPLLFLMAGGPVMGFFYKAVNTMDSMTGYKNERYLFYGRAAAKTDDVVNFLPSRVSAAIMIASAFLLGDDYDGKGALRIWLRDRKNHASPNSAQTESVMAGALGVRLAGDAYYSGKLVQKPYIGDALREIEMGDIRRANRLMYVTAGLCELFCLLVLCAFG